MLTKGLYRDAEGFRDFTNEEAVALLPDEVQ